MRERDVEKYLVEQVESIGGVAEKFTSPGRKHVPDRICSYLYGLVHWVEVKRPGEKPTSGQLRDHDRRKAMGHKVYVVSSVDEVDIYILFTQYTLRTRPLMLASQITAEND